MISTYTMFEGVGGMSPLTPRDATMQSHTSKLQPTPKLWITQKTPPPKELLARYSNPQDVKTWQRKLDFPLHRSHK